MTPRKTGSKAEISDLKVEVLIEEEILRLEITMGYA